MNDPIDVLPVLGAGKGPVPGTPILADPFYRGDHQRLFRESFRDQRELAFGNPFSQRRSLLKRLRERALVYEGVALAYGLLRSID